MELRFSRRDVLAAGLALPAACAAAAPALKPAYRTLGKTGLKVTSLGFGCMLASDPVVFERAADLGINFFDTARSYQGGNNERMVGAALKGKRNNIILASKSLAAGKAEALGQLDTSLKEIGTDYLDIWYLHAKSKPEEISDELLEAQQIARKAGKIRFAGVSTHANMQALIPYLVAKGQHQVILTAYNFTMQPAVGEAIRAARQAGVGIVAMKVMAGGYNRIKRGDRLYGADPNALLSRLQKEGAMLAALKWALKNQSVDSAIVGITDLDQVDEDVRAMAEPFQEKDAKLLSA